MLLEDFNEKYDLSSSAVHVFIGQGKLPRCVLYKPTNALLHIDEEWFIKRLEFKKKVVNYCQDMYYLLTAATTEYRISVITGITTPWFSKQLFALETKSILSPHVNGVMWKFFRFCRKVQRTIKIRYGIEFDIAEILDEEAKICERKKTETDLKSLVNLLQKKEMQSLLPSGYQRISQVQDSKMSQENGMYNSMVI